MVQPVWLIRPKANAELTHGEKALLESGKAKFYDFY